jgi:thioesterase domain-containing protein
MTEPSTAGARLSCHAVEHVVCGIWAEYFGRDVSPYDDFWELGGDSLAMIDLVARARELGLPVRSSVALRNPSPARLAEALTVGADAGPVVLQALCATPEPIVVTGSGEPLHVVHSDSHVELERTVVESWESPRPVTGFAMFAGSVATGADRLLTALLRDRPEGPYRLAGFGHGAVLAFELAVRLRALDESVAMLAMINPPAAGGADEPSLRRRMTVLARRFGLRGTESAEELHDRMRQAGWYAHLRAADLPAALTSSVDFELSLRDHEPAPYDGPAVLVTDGADPSVWQRAIADLDVHPIDHGVTSPAAVLHAPELALIMRKALHR